MDPATASAEPGGEPADDFLFPGQHVPSPKSAASPKAAATPKSTSSHGKPRTSTDRSILVNKIVEGLRGDAFLFARDVGLETLSQPGGLEQLIEAIRNHVFPRAFRRRKRFFSCRTQAWRSRVKAAVREHAVICTASPSLVELS